MRDEMQRNPGTISGTPTVISSMLSRDADPDLRFAGGSSFTVPHSSTLNLLNGAVGGMAMAFMLNAHEYPAIETAICVKNGEYGFTMLPDGTLRWYNTGLFVDSSAPIPLDTDVFVTGVYNGGYSGDPKAGKTTQGSLQAGMGADYMAGSLTGENNMQVCRFEMLERGQVYQIVMDLQRYDNVPYLQDVAAVAYADDQSKLAQSDGQLLGDNVLGTRPREWVVFPLAEPFVLEKGEFVRLGHAGGARHTSESPVMLFGYESSGGAREYMNSVVSASNAGPASQATANPFVPAGSDAVNIAVYADYTPLARTGEEGNLLIYLDGQEDARAAYTSGITASTNDLSGPGFDVSMGELMLWSRKLGPVEVAQLYAAR